MNSTLKNISETTTDLKVLGLVRTLIGNKGKLFRAVFTKKGGSVRTMEFTTATNWNPLNGIETTDSGMAMIATKCARNMATVCEKLDTGVFQPRTLNLATVISLEIVK